MVKITDHSAITYVSGDATYPVADGHKTIVHCCNDIGKWGKGFVLAISKRWAKPRDKYIKLHNDTGLGMGVIQRVPVEFDIDVVNIICLSGIVSIVNPRPINLGALTIGLMSVAIDYQKMVLEGVKSPSIHMPRIGCGLAGSNWATIEPIIRDTLLSKNIPVFVYDL